MTKEIINSILNIFELDDITIIAEQIENQELRQRFIEAWNVETTSSDDERKILSEAFLYIETKIREDGLWEYFETAGLKKQNLDTFGFVLQYMDISQEEAIQYIKALKGNKNYRQLKLIESIGGIDFIKKCLKDKDIGLDKVTKTNIYG